MSHACHHAPLVQEGLPASLMPTYRRLLWTVLVINAAMFVFEAGAGLAAGSVSLQADALDFLGDSATYALSLWVLARPPRWRAGAAIVKGASMLLFAIWVMGSAVYHALAGGVPQAEVMGAVGLVALAANLVCAFLLFRFRHGDSNVRSVWLCTRNDALGNLAVVAAASGVFATNTAWPDLGVAAIMAALATASAVAILRQAVAELGAHGSAPAR